MRYILVSHTFSQSIHVGLSNQQNDSMFQKITPVRHVTRAFISTVCVCVCVHVCACVRTCVCVSLDNQFNDYINSEF